MALTFLDILPAYSDLWLLDPLNLKQLGPFFLSAVLFSSVVHNECDIYVKYNEYLVSTLGVDDLVLQHQDIYSHSAEYATKYSQLFIG